MAAHDEQDEQFALYQSTDGLRLERRRGRLNSIALPRPSSS